MDKSRVKFFQGTSDDLDGLHERIAEWLDNTSATPLNFAFNTRYCEQEDRWAILGVVLYQPGPVARTRIAVPGLGFSPN
jgi:hypothetical protein